jgi:hypothetical protein
LLPARKHKARADGDAFPTTEGVFIQAKKVVRKYRDLTGL